jgi:hypothetical protein
MLEPLKVMSVAVSKLVSRERTNYDLLLGSASGQMRVHDNVTMGQSSFLGSLRLGDVVQLRFILGHVFKGGVALNVQLATFCSVFSADGMADACYD